MGNQNGPSCLFFRLPFPAPSINRYNLLFTYCSNRRRNGRVEPHLFLCGGPFAAGLALSLGDDETSILVFSSDFFIRFLSFVPVFHALRNTYFFRGLKLRLAPFPRFFSLLYFERSFFLFVTFLTVDGTLTVHFADDKQEMALSVIIAMLSIENWVLVAELLFHSMSRTAGSARDKKRKYHSRFHRGRSIMVLNG